jgi:hypothetical protein
MYETARIYGSWPDFHEGRCVDPAARAGRPSEEVAGHDAEGLWPADQAGVYASFSQIEFLTRFRGFRKKRNLRAGVHAQPDRTFAVLIVGLGLPQESGQEPPCHFSALEADVLSVVQSYGGKLTSAKKEPRQSHARNAKARAFKWSIKAN